MADSAAHPRTRRTLAYGVHLLTASGVLFAALAVVEAFRPDPDPRWVFLWLVIAVVIDSIDGPMARRLDVRTWAASIDGRKIDDLVDYLTFTFVPLLLVWRLGWVPAPELVWVGPALVASLFGFANEGAKQEAEGFFGGFPSYWNVAAFYAGIAYPHVGPWPVGVMLLALAVLTVLPVRFVYPNLAPRGWRGPLVVGAGLWLAILLAMLPDYPRVEPWLVLVSLAYPLFYTVLSIKLACAARARR